MEGVIKVKNFPLPLLLSWSVGRSLTWTLASHAFREAVGSHTKESSSPPLSLLRCLPLRSFKKCAALQSPLPLPLRLLTGGPSAPLQKWHEYQYPPLFSPFLSLSLQRCLSIPRTLKVHSGGNSNGRSLGGRGEGPKWISTHGPFFSSPLWPFPEDFFFLFFFFIFSADPRRERKIEGGGELLFLFPPRVRKFEGRGGEIVFHSLPPPPRNFRKGKREY